MKRLIPLLAITLVFSSCALSNDVLNAKKEAEDAVINLAEEAIQTKEFIETKVGEVQTAADSLSEAVDAVNQASSDLKQLTGKDDK